MEGPLLMSASPTTASTAPVRTAQPVVIHRSVTLDVPRRPATLLVSVSAPETGTDLPVILLSHGHGVADYLTSLHGRGPLADFWAAHGFVVIMPTHLDSTTLDRSRQDQPQAPPHWRSRADDISFILDHLDELEAAVPTLAGRLDRDRIAVAGSLSRWRH